MTHTHPDLVRISAAYARTNLHHTNIVTEVGSDGQFPDVWSWCPANDCSHIFECKVSVSDMQANGKKLVMHGVKRVLVVPADMRGKAMRYINHFEYGYAGWGLLVVNPDGSVEYPRKPVVLGNNTTRTNDFRLLLHVNKLQAIALSGNQQMGNHLAKKNGEHDRLLQTVENRLRDMGQKVPASMVLNGIVKATPKTIDMVNSAMDAGQIKGTHEVVCGQTEWSAA